MPDSSAFWTAYSSAVKSYIFAGVTPPKDNQLFVLPFTVPFTDTTTSLTAEQVNYLVYNLADTTRATDGSTGHYAQELSAYLNSVDEDSLLDPSAKAELDAADAAVKSAQKDLDQETVKAKAVYDALPDPKPPFEQWVLQNWPPYAAAQRTLKSAQTEYNTACHAYYGRLDALKGYQTNITQALDTKALHTGYNMAAQKDGENSTFAPKYSSFGLKDQLNSWIQGNGQEQVFFEVKVDSATPPGASVQSGIYLKMTTKGMFKYDVTPGQWNVEGVKTLYPKRESGASDVLDPKYARPISFLVAYAPKLEVEIKEEGGQSARSATPIASYDTPYATVLGIVGQHFPAN